MKVKVAFQILCGLIATMFVVGCSSIAPIGTMPDATTQTAQEMQDDTVVEDEMMDSADDDDHGDDHDEADDDDHAAEDDDDDDDHNHGSEDDDDDDIVISQSEAEAELIAADEVVEVSAENTAASTADRVLTVGSRDFTEQFLLAHISMQLLSNAGFEIIDNTGLGGTKTAQNALLEGEIDLYWEYTGTALAAFHNMPSEGLPANSQIAYDIVSALDANHNDVIWLEQSAFNDTYTMMVNQENAKLDEIESLEDLAEYMNDNGSPLTFCVENDFYSRGDGFFPLLEFYGFTVPEDNINLVAYEALYEELRSGGCDVAEGFSTDGRISAWGLRNLADSLEFFPAYNAAAIVRLDVLEKYPEIDEILSAAAPFLDDATMTELNARVDLGADGVQASGDEETLEEVAASFIADSGLDSESATIVVGSRDFTEQFVLAHITMRWLENAGYNVVDKTGLGGTQTGHDALRNAEIDILWEYTGTALSAFHKIPSTGLPTDPALAWSTASALDALHNNLIWHKSSKFNDTYTLMIKPDRLDVELNSISDLADFMNENGSPLTLCVENDFFGRSDGLYPMLDHYGFTFADENIELVAYDQLYEGLRDGLCDVAEGFSTDGRISAWDLQNLADDKLFFPAYNAAPIVRQEVLDANPDVSELLDVLGDYLDDTMMTRLNARVDVGSDGLRDSGDEQSLTEVADLFLCGVGLVECSPEEAASLYDDSVLVTSTGSAETLTVDAASASCQDMVANGGFEINSGWLLEPVNGIARLSAAQQQTGAQSLELVAQSVDTALSIATASQSVMIIEDAVSAEMQFAYLPVSADYDDALNIVVANSDGTEVYVQQILASDGDDWMQQSIDLTPYAGEEVVVKFVVNNTVGEQASQLFVDDVSIVVCGE